MAQFTEYEQLLKATCNKLDHFMDKLYKQNLEIFVFNELHTKVLWWSFNKMP